MLPKCTTSIVNIPLHQYGSLHWNYVTNLYIINLITIDINVDAIVTMVNQLQIRDKVGLSQCTLLY